MTIQLVEIQKVETHKYVSNENGRGGCQQCGKGVGALEHNTTQPFWYAYRNTDLSQASK